MLDRELRRRLAELGRRRPAVPATPEGPHPPISVPAQKVTTVGQVTVAHGSLAELLPGTPRAVPEGEYYEVTTPVAAHGDWAMQAVEKWLEAIRTGAWQPPAGAEGVPPEAVLFMDTETTGLGNEPLFLVGLLSLTTAGAVITQLLARHYGEEPAVLAETSRRLMASGLLVTYNGRTFDLPYVRNRLRYHQLPAPRFEPHLDLLPLARRKYGRTWGNCRLQTLETKLCQRQRIADIPGGDIPQAYHDFVADGDAGQLSQIITHNSLDIITLTELCVHLNAVQT